LWHEIVVLTHLGGLSIELQTNNDQFHQEVVKMIQLMHSIESANGGEDELEQAMRKCHSNPKSGSHEPSCQLPPYPIQQADIVVL
jgi:hypothetical protein